MSFYFAHLKAAHSKQTVSKLVEDKGLGYIRASPDSVQVSVLTAYSQPGYACYSRNLPAFMEATLRNHRVLISNRGYPITTVPVSLPWKLPPVIYEIPVKLSTNHIEELETHSERVASKGKPMGWVMRAPTVERIRTLAATFPSINKKTRHILGTVNVEAVRAILVIQKILSAFLLTHVYPAFRHESDAAPSSEVDVDIVVKKRKISNTSYVKCVSNIKEHIEDPTTEHTEDEDGDEVPIAMDTTDIELAIAKPSNISGDRWGPIQTIPNASGLFVPFVKELAAPDNSTVPTLFTNHFLRCLSDDQHAMFEEMNWIRGAWGVICQTDLGHEITHLCKCIDIALRAQAIVYPVYYNEVYEGCTISGSGFTVNINKESYTPLSYDALQALVRNSSKHGKALRTIKNVVGDDEDDDSILECTSMRELSHLVKEATLNDNERQEILAAAFDLSFPGHYWPTNLYYIKRALDLIANTTTVIEDDIPLLPNYLFSSDRIEVVLSAFGHQAPTFMIEHGAKRLISSAGPPENFVVRTIATQVAIANMKYMIENRLITNDPKSLSNKHRDQPIKGPDKVDVWKLLKQVCAATTDETDPKPAVKPAVRTGARNASDSFGF